MPRSCLLALALAAGVSFPVQALDLQNLSEADRKALHTEIRLFLQANPDVIRQVVSTPAAVAPAAAAPAAPAKTYRNPLVASNAAEIFDDGYSWVGGNPDGDITLVAFMDYRCGYCRQAYDEVEKLLESDGNIRLIIKELPVLGSTSVALSKFAMSTQRLRGDDAYAAIHEALMRYKGPTDNSALVNLLASLGYDTEGVTRAMNDSELRDIIRKNRDLAQRLEITGTPSFVMEDQILGGYMKADKMQQVAQAVRAQK